MANDLLNIQPLITYDVGSYFRSEVIVKTRKFIPDSETYNIAFRLNPPLWWTFLLSYLAGYKTFPLTRLLPQQQKYTANNAKLKLKY